MGKGPGATEHCRLQAPRLLPPSRPLAQRWPALRPVRCPASCTDRSDLLLQSHTGLSLAQGPGTTSTRGAARGHAAHERLKLSAQPGLFLISRFLFLIVLVWGSRVAPLIGVANVATSHLEVLCIIVGLTL